MTFQADATILVDPDRRRIDYSRHIFGHFIEHFHRQIYGGIFEPGSPLADERGFRLDVLEALRELRVPNVRWPGGCFVSAYHWVDGIGPERTPVYDRAWRVTEPNTFGTDEFLEWCALLGADPYLCTNAGTGTPEEMADWLEYTNRPTGSRWSDRRAMIEASGQDHIRIAFDEWNLRGWHHPVGTSAEAIRARDLNDDNSTYAMADALFSASFLNACLRNADKVGMTNIAPTVNTRGPLFVHRDGVVRRTTFHVMSMYANLLGSHLLDSEVRSASLTTGDKDVPQVDSVATIGGDGRAAVVVVNKHPSAEATIELRIGGRGVSGECRAVILSGATPDSFNDVENPDAVVPLDATLTFADGRAVLPAHSLSVVFIDDAAAPARDYDWSTGPRGSRR